MLEIKQSDYFTKLKLLKICGVVREDEISDVKVYINQKEIGETNIGTYVYNANSRGGDSILNWCFTKVIEYDQLVDVTVVGYKGENKKIENIVDNLIIRDDVPKEYISTIGNKNGITINGGSEKEREFALKANELRYCTPMNLLHIEISSKCNLECKYCIVSNGYNTIDRGLITDEILNKAIQGINELKTIKNIQISGLGEPTLNPRLAEICRRIYEETYVRNVQFFTNGMMFSRELSDQLAEIPLNFKITFSIDGNSAEENDFYRKGSNYDTVKKNLLYFLSKIKNRENFWIRIHNLQINQLNKADIFPPKFLLEDFGNIQIDSHRPFTFPGLSRQKLTEDGICVYEIPNKKICKRTFSECTIRHNGDIIRCHWDSKCEIIMGNLLDNSLKNIWYGKGYINQRKLMMPNVSFEHLPDVCKRCHAMNDGYLYQEEKA